MLDKKRITVKNSDVMEFLKESNAIEGVYGPESLKEAKEAWDYAFENRNNISLKYILEIHRLLLQRLNPRIAGTVRKCDVYIGGNRKIFVSEALIEEDLKQWCKETNKKISGMPLNDMRNKITQWHIDFENIHPHEDGNGRTGRILMNIQRLKAGLPIWIIHEGNEQLNYYELFNK